MINLETNADELKGLFPREIEDIEVFVPESTGEHLKGVYFQREVMDPGRDWEAYREWIVSDAVEKTYDDGTKIRLNPPFPKSFDPIYSVLANYVEEGDISEEDRILLEFHLRTDMESKEDVVYFSDIRRNRASDLKGLGGKFYTNMCCWLKERGFRFLKGLPLGRNLHPYWREQGMVSISELKDPQRKYLSNPGDTEDLFVKVL